MFEGCPGSQMMDLRETEEKATQKVEGRIQSRLRQWPIQMHLISPEAPYFQGADVVLAADCVAYALGSFHTDYLEGRSIGIACPKLDEGQDIYMEKIKSWIDDAKINTLTVLIMQVPCCMGLLQLAQHAAEKAQRKVPIKYAVVSIKGEILREEWV